MFCYSRENISGPRFRVCSGLRRLYQSIVRSRWSGLTAGLEPALDTHHSMWNFQRVELYPPIDLRSADVIVSKYICDGTLNT